MLTTMDGNIPRSTPPSTPPMKRRRIDAPQTTRFPSFEEEPHTSPGKIGELGLHVLLSPKNYDIRRERVVSGGRALTFGEDVNVKVEIKEEVDGTDIKTETRADSSTVERDSKLQVKVEDEEPMEYWDRPRESMYVTAFNTAVDTVIEREGHLFSSEEMDIINMYRNLPCASPCSVG